MQGGTAARADCGEAAEGSLRQADDRGLAGAVAAGGSLHTGVAASATVGRVAARVDAAAPGAEDLFLRAVARAGSGHARPGSAADLAATALLAGHARLPHGAPAPALANAGGSPVGDGAFFRPATVAGRHAQTARPCTWSLGGNATACLADGPAAALEAGDALLRAARGDAHHLGARACAEHADQCSAEQATEDAPAR